MQRIANELLELLRAIPEIEEVRVSFHPTGFTVYTVVDVIEAEKATSVYESELRMVDSYPETSMYFRLIERRGCPLPEIIEVSPSDAVARP